MTWTGGRLNFLANLMGSFTTRNMLMDFKSFPKMN